MSKICTDIKQSKKLIELGLDVYTADMHWWNCHGWKLSANPYTEEVKKGFETHCLECIPAWSLTALLNLLPEWGLKKPEQFPNGKYTCWDYELNNARYADNPVDAAFKMVVWSIENGYIKTGACGVLNDLLNFIDSLGEPVSEGFEKALAREWQGYNDRGASTVDALEDNTQELAFAKGFYKGAKWQKEQDLELTWEDIEKITDIWYDLHEDETVYSKTGCDTPKFYQEVCNRFKEMKGE